MAFTQYTCCATKRRIKMSVRHAPGVNVRTSGTTPPSACALAMAAKQPWKCKGCQPSDEIRVVEVLLANGADQHAVSKHGNTVLMDIAGAGNVPMFHYFCTRILNRTCSIPLDAVNNDYRTLYTMMCGKEEYRGKRRSGSNWSTYHRQGAEACPERISPAIGVDRRVLSTQYKAAAHRAGGRCRGAAGQAFWPTWL